MKGRLAMSNRRVNYNDFSQVMVDILNDYVDDVFDAVKETSDDLGAKALVAVRGASPRDTGDYAAGWMKVNRNSRKNNYYAVRIRNKTEYRLTHLLNFGHVFKSYGHVWGRYRGDNHITRTELEFKRRFGVELKTKLER